MKKAKWNQAQDGEAFPNPRTNALGQAQTSAHNNRGLM